MRRLDDFMGVRRRDTQKPSAPDGVAIFAVGDIHGRMDLLIQMHQQILTQAKDLPATMRKHIVYLGDYIDHGPQGADVIDAFVSAPLPGFKSHYLLGNHELALIAFLRGQEGYRQHADWLYRNGGIETLRNYGVDILATPTPENLSKMRAQLLRKIPTDHLTFLQNLQLSYSLGDFYFVHAGINPNRPLEAQTPTDQLNTHHNFLCSSTIYEKVIVHGETICETPNVRPNRIGIDTGAFESNMLTGLMVIGKHIHFLHSKSYA